jgi:hypothetical protein
MGNIDGVWWKPSAPFKTFHEAGERAKITAEKRQRTKRTAALQEAGANFEGRNNPFQKTGGVKSPAAQGPGVKGHCFWGSRRGINSAKTRHNAELEGCFDQAFQEPDNRNMPSMTQQKNMRPNCTVQREHEWCSYHLRLPRARFVLFSFIPPNDVEFVFKAYVSLSCF